MIAISLQPLPSQRVTVRLDGVRWDLTLKDVDGAVAATILRDSVPVISGTRALAGEWLIPYPRLESGNFMFATEGDELPTSELFGATQTLVYFSPQELAEIRNG